MKSWQHILFDLDGTLTDSKPGITRGVQHALDAFGIQVDDLNQLEPYIGPPLLESFMKIHGLTESQAQSAIVKYREYYTTKGILEHRVYPGIPELLKTLTLKGLACYVATSKPTPFAEKMLQNDSLSGYFRGIYGSFLDGRRTEKAEVIEAVMQTHRLTSEKTVMIGDRSHDVKGASQQGIQAIGVLYGYGSREELQAAGADFLAKDIEQLGQLLLSR